MQRRGARSLFLGALGLACAHTARVDPSLSPKSAPPGAMMVARDGPGLDVRQVPPAVFLDPARQKKIDAALPEIHDVVAQFVEADRPVGLAVGLVVDGALVFDEGFGVRHAAQGGAVDKRTAFRIGSITKVFTAMTALKLWEEGKLDLDAPAAATLPELHTLVYPTADARPLTVRDILTHTSGLPRDPDVTLLAPGAQRTREELMQAIDGLSLMRPPGIGYEYSNLGFALLGHVITAASEQPFDVAIHDAILAPLGMEATVWEPGDVPEPRLALGHIVVNSKVYTRPQLRHGALGAAGGLLSTVEDLARFAAAQLAAWPPRSDADDGLLARTHLREAQRMRTIHTFRARTAPEELTKSGVEGGAYGVGLAWGVSHGCEQSYAVAHNGAVDGYRATVRMLPYAGIGIIVLANSSWADTDLVAGQIQGALSRHGALTARAAQPLPVLTETAEKVIALFAGWEAATFAEWSTHALASASASARLAETMTWLHAGLGDCTLGPLKRATGPWSGVFTAQCEHGDAELTLTLTSAHTPKIAGISLAWREGAPTKAMDEAAAAGAALLEKFDAAEFAAIFSPGYPRTALERTTARVQFDHGTCRLDHALEVQSPQEATYALDCDRGAAKLSVALDRGQPARIVSFRVTSTGPLPVCR